MQGTEYSMYVVESSDVIQIEVCYSSTKLALSDFLIKLAQIGGGAGFI